MTTADLVALLESIAHSAARQGHGGGWCVAECLMCAELPKIDAALTALKSGAVVLVNPEELAAKIQAGIVDYINKFGKPIR